MRLLAALFSLSSPCFADWFDSCFDKLFFVQTGLVNSAHTSSRARPSCPSCSSSPNTAHSTISRCSRSSSSSLASNSHISPPSAGDPGSSIASCCRSSRTSTNTSCPYCRSCPCHSASSHTRSPPYTTAPTPRDRRRTCATLSSFHSPSPLLLSFSPSCCQFLRRLAPCRLFSDLPLFITHACSCFALGIGGVLCCAAPGRVEDEAGCVFCLGENACVGLEEGRGGEDCTVNCLLRC